MRISDWSSDVCSSDLIAEFQKGLFFRSKIGKRAGFELCKDVRQHRRHCIVKGLYLSKVGRRPLGQPCGLSRQHPLAQRSEEHTSELHSLMRISYAVFCLTKHKQIYITSIYTLSHQNHKHIIL